MRNIVLVLFVGCGLFAITFGQEAASSVSKNNYSDSKPFKPNDADLRTNLTSFKNTDEDEDVIKIDSSLVTIPVSVTNTQKGLFVSGITKNEFKIFEDGVEQEIAYFGAFDKAFTVILILDTSPSTKYKIEEIQNAAKFFVDQLKPNDRVEIIKFNEKIRVLAKATNKREKIYKAIKKARFSGGTSLYDVVDFALKERLKRVSGRKALVLFTDGVDTTSEDAFFEDTVKQAEQSDTLIFPIYYNTSSELIGRKKKTKKRNRILKDYKFGKMYLEQLATTTGGRILSPEDSSPDGLNSAFKAIAEELSYQYNIGYYPKIEGIPGQRKNIKVRVYRPNLNVRARDNYIVKTQ